MRKYIISEKRLKELLFSEDRLNALENAGVDNWDNYGCQQDTVFETQEEVEEAIKNCEEWDADLKDEFITIKDYLTRFKEYKGE